MYVRVPRSLVLQQLCSPPATFASYQSCCTEAAARFHGRKLSWHRSQGAQRIFSAGSAQKVLASSKGLLGKFREASTQEWWMLCWCARAVLCPWDISKAALKQHMRNAVAPGLGWSPGTLQQEQTGVVAVRVTRPSPAHQTRPQRALDCSFEDTASPQLSMAHLQKCTCHGEFLFNSSHAHSLGDLLHVSKCQVGLDGGTTDIDFSLPVLGKTQAKISFEG